MRIVQIAVSSETESAYGRFVALADDGYVYTMILRGDVENSGPWYQIPLPTAEQPGSLKSQFSIEDLKRYLEFFGNERETDTDSYCGANSFIEYIGR